MTAAWIVRLTIQANVNSRFVFFQDADSNLQTALRGLDECFFLVDLPRYISVIAERFFSLFLLRPDRRRYRRYVQFLDHKFSQLFLLIGLVTPRHGQWHAH